MITPGLCELCSGPVRSVRTVDGTIVLLDRGPAPDGTVIVQDDVAMGYPDRASAERAIEGGASQHRLHALTCPAARRGAA